MIDLVDMIYKIAKKRNVDYEEVIEEEVYGFSLRQEILKEVQDRYEK